ncbi:MAG: cold shock domain-containing protein [Magnetospirillum sp.]|jgi:cold shock protein|nr:cold shock domain-containing protein [Magnetospirillum sp.]
MPPFNPGPTKTIEAVVKWFNTTKGFGFIAPTDGSPDVFLHAAALEQAGLPPPAEGAKIKCEVGPGKKGPQVMRVHEVDGRAGTGGGAGGPSAGPGGPRGPRAPRGPGGGGSFRERDDVDLAGAIDVEGKIKWYSPEKGYGFVVANDGGKDVFVNAAVLRRSGVPSVDLDQLVRTSYVVTPRGREARYIRLL